MSRIADPKAKVALLRAAEQVFAERGLAGAKVEDIARRAGLSKGAFYLHFDSKEAAIKQVVESFLAQCTSFFAPPSEYPNLPEDPAELLDFSIERDVQMFEFLWENRAMLKILAVCQGEFDSLRQAFRAEIDRRNREWLALWSRLGLLREGLDLELASALIGGGYHDLTAKMLGTDGPPPLEPWLHFAQEAFMRAFGSRDLVALLDRRNRGSMPDIEGDHGSRPHGFEGPRRRRQELRYGRP